jgi:hypothetical protein
VTVERLESINPDRVVAFLRSTARARASGVPVELDSANVYDLANGKITGLRIGSTSSTAASAIWVHDRVACASDRGGEPSVARPAVPADLFPPPWPSLWSLWAFRRTLAGSASKRYSNAAQRVSTSRFRSPFDPARAALDRSRSFEVDPPRTAAWGRDPRLGTSPRRGSRTPLQRAPG